MEHEYAKGTNQIASAVFNRLNETDMSNYSNIRLCADSYERQNRNYNDNNVHLFLEHKSSEQYKPY